MYIPTIRDQQRTYIHIEFRKTNYGKYSISFKGAII